MTTVWHRYSLSLFPSLGLFIGYWDNVTNAQLIHKRIVNRLLPSHTDAVCVFLDAANIFAPRHIEAAVNQALLHLSSGSLITNDFATEVIFCLSPTRSIKHALATFGASSETRRLLAAVICTKTDSEEPPLPMFAQYLSELEHLISGSPQDLVDLSRARENVIKVYGITDDELAIIDQSPLPDQAFLDSTLTRMSARELCRV
ncbi:unnamed protein product [Dicrocoelium dendriticum]|nr:unnamed protein product [Dicrocoelium dendriticum]